MDKGTIDAIRVKLNLIKLQTSMLIADNKLGSLYFNKGLSVLNNLNDIDEWLYDLEEKDYNKENE